MIKGKISVIMGAFNCHDTIEDAVKCIQNQTYENWELVICEDGSSDDTWSVLKSLAEKDERIVLLRNEHNIGLNRTLNRCLKSAGGEFIARMDGDDLCEKERFEKQISLLNEHPEFAICGSEMALFDETGVWGKTTVPEYPDGAAVVSGTPICHATIMARKSAFDDVDGYSDDVSVLRVEDVDLWIRMYEKGYRCINIQEPLYLMRNDQNALNRRKYRYRINSTKVRLRGCRDLHLGFRSYLSAFRPMINGLVPAAVRKAIRRITYRH